MVANLQRPLALVPGITIRIGYWGDPNLLAAC
jgi:hypothetical protein